MLGSVSSHLSGHDKRFHASVWLPVQGLLGGLVAIVIAGTGWSRAGVWWQGQGVVTQFALLAGALSAGTLLARVIGARLLDVMRVFEGRWPGARTLADRGRRVQRRRSRRLRGGRSPDLALILYPASEADVQPTRFGNVLRAGEAHAWERYRMDAVVFWPRLFACLPERPMAELAAIRTDLDLMVTVSLCGYVYAVTAPLVAWWVGVPVMIPIGIAAGLIIGRLAYGGAVRCAVSYMTAVRAAFDVYRFGLLDALGWQRPSSWKDERRQWQAIGALWLRGAVDSAEDAARLGYPAPPCRPAERDG